jgi:hypothetical protein
MMAMMNPEVFAAIIVCGAFALILLLAWRLKVELRQRLRNSSQPLAWEPTGNETVWEVYNKWRDAELGIKYLEPAISGWDASSRTIDIIIALSTASSVGSLAFFRDFWWGVYAWNSLAAIGGLLAIVRPFLGFQDKIKNRQELLKAYTVLSTECDKVSYIIICTKNYEDATQHLYRLAFDRFTEATRSLEMERAEIKNLPEEKRRALMKRVEKELPTERFFVPSATPRFSQKIGEQEIPVGQVQGRA